MTNYYEHWSFRHRQRGLTLIEVAVVLAIASVIAAGVSRQLAENAEAVKVRNAASQMDLVVEAAQAYMSARQADLITATAGGPVTVPITGGTCTGATPSLQACGYLPSAFVNASPYDQTHTLRIRQPSANVLEGFVGTTGGNAIPSAKVPRAASLIGPEGGFVGEADVPGCPVGAACGSYGGWQIDSATLASIFPAAPTAGHLVSAIAFANGAVVPDYLYRVSVPGHPEANQMFTGLHMDGGGVTHDVDGVATLTAEDGVFSDSLTVGQDATVTRDLAIGRDLTVAGATTVTGDAAANDVILSGLSNQRVSQAIYSAGVYPSSGNCAVAGDCVPKPTCPSGMTAQVFLSPSDFSDNGVAGTISRVESYATSFSAAYWQVFVRVRTESGWITANSANGRVTAFAKCS